MLQHWDLVIEHINKIAEKENLRSRYTSLFELYRISIDTRQDLDTLREKAWGKPKQQEQKQEQEQGEQNQEQERRDWAK
jgi:hypothetical protein